MTSAGPFSSWLAVLRRALDGDGDTDVPCGACTACCRSSQFVHIAPDETDTLAHIPRALLFPAPGLPRGHVLLGYDQRGRCPMLADDGCSIYAHRPRTCRIYDCRVFAATDVVPDEPEKAAIAEQARHWRFEHPTETDAREHDAVRAAAAFLRERAGELPVGEAPRTSTQLAVAAVEVAEVFVGGATPLLVDVVRLLARRRG